MENQLRMTQDMLAVEQEGHKQTRESMNAFNAQIQAFMMVRNKNKFMMAVMEALTQNSAGHPLFYGVVNLGPQPWFSVASGVWPIRVISLLKNSHFKSKYSPFYPNGI
jgi:hypothetical protein